LTTHQPDFLKRFMLQMHAPYQFPTLDPGMPAGQDPHLLQDNLLGSIFGQKKNYLSLAQNLTQSFRIIPFLFIN
jgi:hypothetical protein